jgi:type-F conjugative transfer system pilin assembly protein TrbC
MKKILQTLIFFIILSGVMGAMTPDLQRKIDARLKEAKAKKIYLFSDKKCSGDCFGQPITKDDLEKMTAFLGVKPDGTSESDQHSAVNASFHKQEMTVFVSNSMPKAALKGLVIEAGQMKEVKVRFVIQGMVQDSMPKTAQLVENIGHPLEIDPKLFEVHKVTHVPVFMTTRGDKVYRLQGNVTLDFAVEKLMESANNSIDKKEGPKK